MKPFDPDQHLSLVNEFGITARRLPEDQAPPVSRELLRALAGRQLSPEQADRVYDLIAAFGSWQRAYADLLSEAWRDSPAANLLRAPADIDWDRIAGLLLERVAQPPGLVPNDLRQVL